MLDTPFTEKLSFHARRVLKEARDIARYTKSQSIEPRHLLLALALENGSLGSILLDHIGFEKEKVGKLCLKKESKQPKKSPSGTLALSPTGKDILKRAFFLASRFGYPYVGTEHLVSALLESNNEELENILHHLNIDEQKMNTVIESHLHFEQFPQLARMFDTTDLTQGNRSKTGSATPFLDQYSIDLGRDAEKRSEQLIGRERELERLIQILGRKQKNNALLLGEPGVGKTALVAALARKIDAHTAGPVLAGKKILSLDLTLLVAGTSFRGEFESRIKEVLQEAKTHPNIILFIDEIHTLIGTGNANGGLDAANILKPALARGEIQVIGATTFSEYKRHFEKDAALERRFQLLTIDEPTPEETKEILYHTKHAYEKHHALSISDDAVEASVQFSIRYLTERFLPDKALDLLDEAASLVRRRDSSVTAFNSLIKLEREKEQLLQQKEHLIADEQYDAAAKLKETIDQIEKQLSRLLTPDKNLRSAKKSVVTRADVLRVVAQMTGIPLSTLASETPRARLARIRLASQDQVIGQSEAMQDILSTLTRSVSGINDPNRPLGSFLFLGPTGVGKTHLAKVLAREFFGDERALIRLDMSEFMERHSIAQILGAPAGYVGYGEGGKLTEQVRRRPYSVILFDEIEKAHPDVSNLLLQILDEGILSDAEGRRVSFKNTLIILTSNIGTSSFTETAKIGFGQGRSTKSITLEFDSVRQRVLEELKKTLRPELISRLDHVLVFQPLNAAALEKITRLELLILGKRLAKEGIALRISASLIHYIAEKSFAPDQGARLIRKNIQSLVEQKIATYLLSHPKQKTLTISTLQGKVTCR